ncbi:hypothetical protein GUJ93_ZPchr0191g16375 [Zizania palustris]|uniref:Uncharacterized protein n=1 Tax=Zizania palustris TaxID=103762 RepID=A0A8J5VUJ6_ZIZPA|nr:hypothetical protein GUJ93_ZPchr0191g16375 [Zizania palustris]
MALQGSPNEEFDHDATRPVMQWHIAVVTCAAAGDGGTIVIRWRDHEIGGPHRCADELGDVQVVKLLETGTGSASNGKCDELSVEKTKNRACETEKVRNRSGALLSSFASSPPPKPAGGDTWTMTGPGVACSCPAGEAECGGTVSASGAGVSADEAGSSAFGLDFPVDTFGLALKHLSSAAATAVRPLDSVPPGEAEPRVCRSAAAAAEWSSAATLAMWPSAAAAAGWPSSSVLPEESSKPLHGVWSSANTAAVWLLS